MARLTLLLVFALPALVVAAPVPKGVKKKADANGTWELVEFNSNGVVQDHSRMIKLWTLDGEALRVGGSSYSLTLPDPDKPTQRRFATAAGGGAGYAAALEVDGDELRFCYAPNRTDPISECGPATNVMFYRFKRVADAGK